jgi:hypothetical protein
MCNARDLAGCPVKDDRGIKEHDTGRFKGKVCERPEQEYAIDIGLFYNCLTKKEKNG